MIMSVSVYLQVCLPAYFCLYSVVLFVSKSITKMCRILKRQTDSVFFIIIGLLQAGLVMKGA